MIQVKQFTSAAEMREHYRALNARFFTLPERKAPPINVDLTKEIEAMLRAFKEVEVAEPKKPEPQGAFIPVPGPVGAKKIIAHIAREHGMTAEDIIGDGKSAHLVEARWAAILLVHKTNPGWSLPKIGRVFRRDHTSILNALRKMGARS